MHTLLIIISLILFDFCNPFTYSHFPQSIYKSHIVRSEHTQIRLSSSETKTEVDNRNLYEILECPRDASRKEIRKSYISLARTLHPDANIGRDGGYSAAGNTSSTTNGDDFDKVAKAWKILSNDLEKRRYDRSLRAKEFVDDIDEKVSNINLKAAFQVRPILDKLIRPFFKKANAEFTAAITSTWENILPKYSNTTMDDLSGNNNNNDFSSSRTSGENSDIVESVEKIEELEQRTLEDIKLIQYLQQQILEHASKNNGSSVRIDIDQVMTSDDAEKFLTRYVNI